MATKPLQSITFPGLPDTYTVPSAAEDIGAAPMAYARQVGNLRNLLDNSDFTNPVNQRRDTSYTATGSYIFTIDRWKVNYGTVTVADGFINWVSTDGAYYKRIGQIIPYTLKAGQTYTLAVLARVNGVSGWNRLRFSTNDGAGVTGAGVALSASSDFVWFTVNCTPGTALVQPRMEMLVGQSEGEYIDIDIKAMCLYEGEYNVETLPEYQPKGYAAELLECQRYYLFVSRNDTVSLFSAVAYTTTNAYISIPTPIKMRINPTIEYKNLALRRGTTDVSITAFGTPYAYNNCIYIKLDTASGLTAGNVYVLRLNNGSLSFSADL